LKNIFLPKLLNIQVNHYSLYMQQPSFEYTFSDGINAIIGVNGIGKTTFVELILYCLLGFKKEYRIKKYKRNTTLEIVKENTDYFSSRFNSSYSDNNKASVLLTFLLGSNIIEVQRSLFEDKILSLIVNEEKFPEVNDEIYEVTLLGMTGFTNFKSLQTIVRNFLFFDEMRVNVAWEEDNQDEILRILFFDEELLNQFNFLEQKIVELDTRAKHLSEDRRVFRQKLDELLSERAELRNSKNESDHTDPIVYIEKKNKLELDRMELLSNLEQLSNEYKLAEQELNKLIGNRNRTSQQLEQLESEISQNEVKLYSTVYDNLPDFYITLERRLISDGTCLVCNNQHKESIKHFKEYHENGKCLVCSSPINNGPELDYSLVEQINKLSDEKEQLRVILFNQNQQVDNVNKSLKRINESILNDNVSIEEIGRQLIQIESILSEISGNEETDMFSEIVKGREKKIIELNNAISEINEQKRIESKNLNRLHNDFVQLITTMNKKLSGYFNKYASAFIGLKCELVIKNINLHNQNIPHVIYLPKIDGIDRQNIWSVSESQRFFLDQAFRMAIIEYLQDNLPDFQTFFITETPEGSLDVAYEDQVANMFLLFSKSNNNIVFTSNLNSSRFLHKLYKMMDDEEKKTRTLNLLTKGKLTEVHKDHKIAINEILNYVFGEGVL
jgi:DNA repair exonuclease SbcCD ATPase subunit